MRPPGAATAQISGKAGALVPPRTPGFRTIHTDEGSRYENAHAVDDRCCGRRAHRIDVCRASDLDRASELAAAVGLGARTATLVGSLSHGDPASDLPAVAIALGATLVIKGANGTREVSSDDFFQGFLETAVGPDELLIEIKVPKMNGAKWSFQKFNRRAMDWAIVGCAVVVDGNKAGVGLVNMDSRPIRASAVEAAIGGGANATDAAASADAGTEPPADLNASVEYRRHLAKVLVRRALEEAGK